MSTHYLLPCSCGQKLAVSPRQAGQPVTCLCGNVLEVPPLNELRTLEPVAPDAGPKGSESRRGERSAWSGRQAGLFLGVVLLCTSVPWAAWLELSKPRLIPVERMTPLQTWGLWQELRIGANRYPSPQAKAYADALSQNRNWFIVAVGLSLCGVLVCVASYALLKPKAASDSPPG